MILSLVFYIWYYSGLWGIGQVIVWDCVPEGRERVGLTRLFLRFLHCAFWWLQSKLAGGFWLFSGYIIFCPLQTVLCSHRSVQKSQKPASVSPTRSLPSGILKFIHNNWYSKLQAQYYKFKNLYFWFIRNIPEYSEINFEGIHISFMDELIRYKTGRRAVIWHKRSFAAFLHEAMAAKYCLKRTRQTNSICCTYKRPLSLFCSHP